VADLGFVYGFLLENVASKNVVFSSVMVSRYSILICYGSFVVGYDRWVCFGSKERLHPLCFAGADGM